MENTRNSVQSTKKTNKVNYSFEGDGGTNRQVTTDIVVVEQPLQVRLSWFQDGVMTSKVFAITMRTPNDDYQLILGLLFSEGVIRSLNDIESINQEAIEEDNNNQWLVQFVRGVSPELASLERYQMTYSSCGLCGTTSLKSLEMKNPGKLVSPDQSLFISVNLICSLATKMRSEQVLFSQTGATHGAALLNQKGELLHAYEDIGRHNAVDKVVGAHLLNIHDRKYKNLVPDNEVELLTLVVSSRISFEVVQKTIMAGISVLVAVGAPSDLAIQAAKRFDLTLIGFVSDTSFNVYHGDWRIKK